LDLTFLKTLHNIEIAQTAHGDYLQSIVTVRRQIGRRWQQFDETWGLDWSKNLSVYLFNGSKQDK
jgi:hypothetical protein